MNYFGIIVLMLSFALIAGGLILAFVRYQRRILAKQQELHRLDARYKQDLLATSIESAEAQRIRIAKDIHDELGSIFSTLSLSMNQMTDRSSTHFQNCTSLIQTGITSVRRISHAIVPFEIEILGLEQTLDNYFDAIESASGIEIQFEKQAQLETLDNSSALAVYRILQELSSNSIKYAGAKTMTVDIRSNESGSALAVHYKDDGKGVDLANMKFKKGIGLKNIESRAIALGGSAVFSSKPGEGFACQVSVPITSNE